MKVNELSAEIILINKGKILMQLRDNKPGIDYPGYWSIPGGKIEKGEGIKEAAKRELKEETGYVSKNPQFLLSEIYHLGGRIIRRHVFFDVYDGKQKLFCGEGQKTVFKSPKEFKKMKIYLGHARLAKLAVELTQKLN